MLRRKLLIVFGSLVILLAIVTVVGLLMLQGVLNRLNHINSEAMTIVDMTDELNSTLTTVEIELYQLQLQSERHLDELIDNVELMRELTAKIGEHYVTHEPQAEPFYRDMVAAHPIFERLVSSLATAQDPSLARQYSINALAQAVIMRRSVREISNQAREHARNEQLELAEYFRWLVLGMALAAMVVINIAIAVLLQASRIVLKPMAQLVETSRHLAQNQFEHRANVEGNDEFGELAKVYNSLAEQMQTQEQRRMETLGHIALTLNHELNNAIAAIKLQIELLGKRSDGADEMAPRLRQINASLHKMAETVESLKHIRRIVLTDYVEGAMMLDLKRSISQDEQGDQIGQSQPKSVSQ